LLWTAATVVKVRERAEQHHVLVVDDDAEIRETLKEVLEEAGYVVSLATNGADALAALSEVRHASLVLLDLMMPVMDGAEFRRRQLADPQLSDIPVIVLSASGAVGERVRDMKAFEVLRKPFSLDKLLATVARGLR
jgi:CheY-like chemotaxis protein